MKKTAVYIVVSGLLLATANLAAAGNSLFEYYTKTTPETLKAETGEMGAKLKTAFSQNSIKSKQEKIDFSEYFSNLKKSVLYASKLATYSEYVTDLRFARDKEIFKGLPDEEKTYGKSTPPLDRKEFVTNKYGKMKKNVEEEIETYNDLILFSLDTCETLTENDLSGILQDPYNHGKVRNYIRGDEYRSYEAKKERLNQTWPELLGRISAQFAVWEPRPASPHDPIIDPKIIGAI